MKRTHLFLLNSNPEANGGGAPAATNPAPAAPAAPVAPSMPEIFSGMMGSDPGSAPAGGEPPNPAPAPVPPVAQQGPARGADGKFAPKAPDATNPAPPAGGKAPDAPADPVAEFMRRFYSEAPEWMKDENNLQTWKDQREFMAKTLATVKEMSAAELALKQEIEAIRQGKAPQAAAADANAPEALTKLQLELEAQRTKYETELKEWNEEKARRELSGLPAFRAEFEGKKAQVVEAAQSIAKEAGIADDVLKAILGATSEYSLAKTLEGVTDKTAANLLGEKARAYMDLDRKQNSTLKANDPLAELEKWRRIEEANQGAIGARFTDALKAQFNAAVPQVVQALTGKDGDVFFRTSGGQTVLGMIANRFSNGMDLKPAEVLETMAHAQAYHVYRQLSATQASKIAELEKTLKQYEAADPARVAGGAPPGGDPGGSSMLGGIFANMLPAQAA